MGSRLGDSSTVIVRGFANARAGRMTIRPEIFILYDDDCMLESTWSCYVLEKLGGDEVRLLVLDCAEKQTWKASSFYKQTRPA